MMELGTVLRAIALGALIALAACSGKPIDPAMISEPDQIPPGRGLLSGEDGEFTVRL